MVIFPALWKYAGMAKQPPQAGIGARIDAMLRRIKPPQLSERAWLIEAGVNTSFFTDLRTKGSVPSIDKVERLARVAGLSLAEFVSGDDPGGAVSAAQLQHAIADAFPLPPLPTDRQAAYLADIVLELLGLPPTAPTSPASAAIAGKAGRAKAAPARASTKRI